MLLSIYGVFIITFTIFPGVFFASKFYFLDSLNENDEVVWYQIIMILLFNVFDTVGRYAGGKVNVGAG